MHARAVDGDVVGAAVGRRCRARVITAWQGNVRPASRLPAVHSRSRSSLQATKTFSPSAASSRSHAPWPVGRPAITGVENVRPPSWLAATTACTSRVPYAACSHATYTWSPEAATRGAPIDAVPGPCSGS